MTTLTLDVAGMTCGHCVKAVTAELSALGGVTAVDVDLHAGAVSQVLVSSQAPLDPAAVAAAIEEAGYELARPVLAGRHQLSSEPEHATPTAAPQRPLLPLAARPRSGEGGQPDAATTGSHAGCACGCS